MGDKEGRPGSYAHLNRNIINIYPGSAFSATQKVSVDLWSVSGGLGMLQYSPKRVNKLLTISFLSQEYWKKRLIDRWGTCLSEYSGAFVGRISEDVFAGEEDRR